MKILFQIFILMLFTFLGELIASVLPFNFPGSLIGLLLLFISLLFGLIKPSHLKEVSSFLQKYMAFLFVPLCVGLMRYFELIKLHWIEIILVLVVSTLITLITTGLIAQRSIRK
ncbi:CidA/LrgA family protein [Acholeplasma hippikon]|nr:CidA/LrgA family protein [Acholeplasma hippikon]